MLISASLSFAEPTVEEQHLLFSSCRRGIGSLCLGINGFIEELVDFTDYATVKQGLFLDCSG